VWIETPSRNKKKKKRGREKGSRKEEMRCIPQERAANRRTLLRRDEVRWRRKAGRKSLSRQRLKEDLKHLPRQRREGGVAGTKAPPRNKESRILRSYSFDAKNVDLRMPRLSERQEMKSPWRN